MNFKEFYTDNLPGGYRSFGLNVEGKIFLIDYMPTKAECEDLFKVTAYDENDQATEYEVIYLFSRELNFSLEGTPWTIDARASARQDNVNICYFNLENEGTFKRSRYINSGTVVRVLAKRFITEHLLTK